MALDKVVDSSLLDANLTTIADAIRAKGGTTAELAFPAGFAEAIANLETGGGSVPSGFSEIVGGTIVYSAVSYKITIDHGLGKDIKGLVMYRAGATDSATERVNWVYFYPFTFYNTSSGGSFNKSVAWQSSATTRTVFSGFTDSPFSITTSVDVAAGETYYWLAWR